MSTLKKRFQFFSYYIDMDSCSEGGLDDIVCEADTLIEGQILMLERKLKISNVRESFYWLDFDERRQSTTEEENDFLEAYNERFKIIYPPVPREPPSPLSEELSRRMHETLAYCERMRSSRSMFDHFVGDGMYAQTNVQSVVYVKPESLDSDKNV